MQLLLEPTSPFQSRFLFAATTNPTTITTSFVFYFTLRTYFVAGSSPPSKIADFFAAGVTRVAWLDMRHVCFDIPQSAVTSGPLLIIISPSQLVSLLQYSEDVMTVQLLTYQLSTFHFPAAPLACVLYAAVTCA
jgi:hypothetical protein